MFLQGDSALTKTGPFADTFVPVTLQTLTTSHHIQTNEHTSHLGVFLCPTQCFLIGWHYKITYCKQNCLFITTAWLSSVKCSWHSTYGTITGTVSSLRAWREQLRHGQVQGEGNTDLHPALHSPAVVFGWQAFCSLERRLVHRPHFFQLLSITRCTARRWPSRWCLCTNLRPHSKHAKGLSPVCVRSCFRRLLTLLYVLLQTEHVLLFIGPFGGGCCCTGPWGEAACEKQFVYG